MFDFSASMYERLCVALDQAGYISRQFAHYPSLDVDSRIPFVILRHDVDRYPKTAIRLAEIEHDHGITATYFFRMVPGAFDANVIKRVAKLGMEVGYHYETLDRANGDFKHAYELVKEDLADGFITPEGAARDYGVMIEEAGSLIPSVE